MFYDHFSARSLLAKLGSLTVVVVVVLVVIVNLYHSDKCKFIQRYTIFPLTYTSSPMGLICHSKMCITRTQQQVHVEDRTLLTENVPSSQGVLSSVSLDDRFYCIIL